MKLGIINGSPRGNKSNSEKLLKWLLNDIKEEVDITKVFVKDIVQQEENIKEIKNSDYLLFIFPLYTDAMPGQTKAFMEVMEQYKEYFKDIPITYIIHSGFPEAIHSRTVEKYVTYYTKLMGMTYGGCIVMGGSEALQVAPDEYYRKRIAAFHKLGENIINRQQLDEKSLKIVADKEKLGVMQKIMMRIVNIDFYWNRSLKKNGAYQQRFDKPYEKLDA